MSVRHDAWQVCDWEGVATLALGLWLLVSPWGLHYGEQSRVAAEIAWVVGGALVTISVLRSVAFDFQEGIGKFVSGVWLIVSPWEFDYAAAPQPTANAVVVGVLLIVLSLTDDWRENPELAPRHIALRDTDGRVPGARDSRHVGRTG